MLLIPSCPNSSCLSCRQAKRYLVIPTGPHTTPPRDMAPPDRKVKARRRTREHAASPNAFNSEVRHRDIQTNTRPRMQATRFATARRPPLHPPPSRSASSLRDAPWIQETSSLSGREQLWPELRKVSDPAIRFFLFTGSHAGTAGGRPLCICLDHACHAALRTVERVVGVRAVHKAAVLQWA